MAQDKNGAVMLSVRLSAQESAQLQALARANGKSVSEMAREALRAAISTTPLHVLPAGFTATTNTRGPLTLFGSLSPTTTAPEPEVELVAMVRE